MAKTHYKLKLKKEILNSPPVFKYLHMHVYIEPREYICTHTPVNV